MLPDQSRFSSPNQVTFTVQFVAWILGIGACALGMMNLIAEWDPGFATIQFLILAIAPVVWMIERGRPVNEAINPSATENLTRTRLFAGFVGLTSLLTSYFVGRQMVEFPPAYHDEYSYLFQAKTLLSGRLTVPSHATHPQLFDQMHVLNEGRMASRYYPGTGLWLAPWVALGYPYWGQWLASAMASVFVFWTGFELGRLRVALVSGLACALSPGIALFSNLLLAHQPTLAGLTFFIWAFVTWQRTHSPRDAFLAGCGLSFAMICRPATAAGVGAPFGVAFLSWLAFVKQESRTASQRLRIHTLIGMGLPLVIGWTVMLAYHHDVTGSWRTSPYQLYTDIYTPRHVYGFDNVIRGEQKLGPKVIDGYDQWATNLTPSLAAKNVQNRLLASWLWTFDLVPLLLSAVVVIGTLTRWDRRWIPIGFAILTLHMIHVPYWYTGIMGWHYVFESAPLWCLLLGLASDLLIRDWRANGRWLMPGWWILVLLVSLCGIYFPVRSMGLPSSGSPRISNGIGSLRHPRKTYADFDRWIQRSVQGRPAIVLIEIDPDDQHVDYVVNSPSFTDSILRARFRRGVTDIPAVVAAFPERDVYLCDPKRKTIERIASSHLRSRSQADD